ncbi:adenosine deaminase [Silvibacterium dinghuense]|uniref:Adenosine deaminase n=1 Tax=Silvibacterium dinghuense TaxID=1560006 RepID=A0A4Q1SJ16_9BACT|nr:adenosine deaminase [Silvibacterium dinghuense]RXS97628.1 adenosine deaminase [Silvibacterium dinghuense]GGH00665.1 adenosine deaminase [Silvibacterium dinghuense]
MSPAYESFIRRLPKAELHLHLEGTVEPATLVELSRRHDAEPLTLEDAAAIYQYKDFTGFLMAFKAVTERLRTADDYELITYKMLERLAAQGVVHAEVYVAVGVVYFWGRSEFEPLFAGMERGRLRAEADFGMTAYWIFDAVRQFGVEAAARVFKKAAEMKQEYASIVGIGIGGDERQAGPELFRELYGEAKQAGLHLTAHAGETTGPESIWGALNIGAERIGHGLSAIQDAELMEVLAERQVPIEVCISSNVATGCCPQLSDHPVRLCFDAGLMVTLNSDDPAMFHCSLEGEYQLAEREFDFHAEHLRELAANSIEASFLPAERKIELLHRIHSTK